MSAKAGAIPATRGVGRRTETSFQEIAIEDLERTIAEGVADETIDQQAYFLGVLLDTIPDNIYFKDAQSRFTRISRRENRVDDALECDAGTGH